MLPLERSQLHSFWDFHTKQACSTSNHITHSARKSDTECTHIFIAFLHDRTIVIELVIFLHKLIHIVSDKRWAVVLSCFSNYAWEISKTLDKCNFLFLWFYRYKCFLHASFSYLAKKRLNTSISILQERTCISVEVDRFLRIESHILTRVNL